ncbi:MAG: phosphoribosylanthranilate isomerase [Sphingomonadaceae bacterium]|nr:phosphoribosylanthranilate isomerase [Sphingomonadaceae bacterium]
MNAPNIKICGVRTPEALDAAIKGRASHLGFNFFPPSPRHVSARDAAALSARAGDRIIKVGVFVDPDDALLTEAVAAARIDAIQLHGQETPERAGQIKTRFGLPIWKALPVSSEGDIARSENYTGAADFILFDAKTPKGTLPGGMGLSFDWSLLSRFDSSVKWGMAGGLTPANVAQAVRETGAPLVDTSSGVESAPGVKDVDKIAAFCQAVSRC